MTTTLRTIKLQDYIEATDPDKTKRYDALYNALMKHDSDFRFMDAVMGKEWVYANYSTKQLMGLWETVITKTYHIPIEPLLDP